MKGKTHAGVGIVTYLSVCNRLPGEFRFIGLMLVIFASLLPDIDHPKSMVNKFILPFKNKATKTTIYLCSSCIALWFDYNYMHSQIMKIIAVIFVIIALSSHRKGLTHSLLGMAIFSSITGYIGNIYGVKYLVYYFMIGYGMHLFCDMATNRGIPLLYPFKTKNIKLPFTYKTNSKLGNYFEELIMGFGLVFAIYKILMIFR